MKKIIKLLSLLICFIIATSVVGCKKDKEDATKTQLYVGVYDAGTGTDSAYALKRRFEAKYADYSFEEGKQGVEVKIVPARYDTGLQYDMADLTIDVFMGTSANANFLAQKGLLMDITDVYEKPFSYDFVRGTTDASAPDYTFKSYLREDLQGYYNNGGKYYGFPGETTYYGIVYDIDLFEEKNLYFAANGGFVTSKTDARSAGPDGDPTTEYDNGLPATYDEFFTLCDKIVSLGMTPIMWGGNVQEYVSSLLTALAADCDGKEQTELNYSYNGTATTLLKEEGGSFVKDEATPITAANGYELYRTEGRYYALKFLERIISNPNYYNSADATNTVFDHTMAQDMYLLSKYGDIRKRTAMIIEGNWWQKEAIGTFQAMEAENGPQDSAYSRRFGMLPLPKPTADKVGDPYTILERCVGDGFVNANVADHKVNLAKAFVQFIFTEESCKESLSINGKSMPVNLTLTSEEYNALTPWAKSSYDLSTNAVTATMYSNSKIMQNYSQDLWYSPNLWLSTVSGDTYTYPSRAMIDHGVTAENYFRGLSKYWDAETWQDKFIDV